VENFSRTKKDLELRKYNKIRKEVDNTKPKGRSEREDWRRRGWEQVCCWWCIESGRALVLDEIVQLKLVALARLWLATHVTCRCSEPTLHQHQLDSVHLSPLNRDRENFAVVSHSTLGSILFSFHSEYIQNIHLYCLNLHAKVRVYS
jgi:hypothetical protein